MNDTANRNKEFYDAEASHYDHVRYASKQGIRVDAFHRRVLAELAGPDKLDSVLELGCGTGRLLPFFAGRSRELVGIDASDGMLAVARQRIEEGGFANVRVSKGDALALDFPDASFDLVYSILVINLIPDFPAVFREVRRVLRDDGIFVFSLPNLQSLYFPAGLIVNSRGKAFGTNQSGHRYSHWFTQGEIDSALDAAGLSIVNVLGQPPWTGRFEDVTPLNANGIGRLLAKSIYVKAKAR